VTECPADERVFDHEKLFGNAVCVPELPQRIVSLSGVSTEALEQLLLEYEVATDALQMRLTESDIDPTVSILRVRPTGIRVYLPGSFSGTVVSDVGLRRPEGQQSDEFALELSLEEIDEANADIIFLWTFGSSERAEQQSEEALIELKEEPLWQSLGAVQNDAVYSMPGYWIGGGLLAANAIVEDIQVSLTNE
ncbi:MAG: ABC transporter substrate-binding protein, partial [Chloroflexota bacterium]